MLGSHGLGEGSVADPSPRVVQTPDDLFVTVSLEQLTPAPGRDLTPTETTEVAKPAATMVHLLAVDFFDGSAVNTVRLTTAGQPIKADVDGDGVEEVFAGAGGLLGIGTVQETADRAGQGVELKLSGLDSTVLDPLLNQNFRGRTATIWRLYLDEDTGAVTAGPLLLGRFDQLAPYEVEENPPDHAAPGTVTISTRVESPLAALQRTNAVRCNVDSHNRMLERAGLDIGRDTFFQNLPAIIGKRIRWGSGDTPDAATSGSGGGGGTTDPNPEPIFP